MELSTLLLSLGITPNYKAYHQIVTAIALSADNTGILLFMTKELYPAIAQEYHTNWRAVERNIRMASERAWRCNPELLSELAGYQLMESPTSSQLIAVLAAWRQKEQGEKT